MARSRKGNSIQTKLGFLLFGKHGTWKSSLCLDFARMKREDGKPFRVLYIDAEAGSVDTYIDQLIEEGIDPTNLYLIYTQSLKEVNDYIKKATNNEEIYELDDDGKETDEVVLDSEGNPFKPDAIVIDGITVLYIASQQGLTEFSKKRARVRATKNELTGEEKTVAIEGAGLEIKDYNTLKFDGQNFVLSLLASGKHFAITARESDEKAKKETSEKGKFEQVSTGNKIPDGFKDLSYNVKTVLHMIEDEMGNVMAHVLGKDRTLVHQRNEIIEKPTLLDWSVIIEKNKGRREYILANDLNKAVQTEKVRYEKEIDDFSNEQEIKTNNNETMSVQEYHSKIKSVVDSLTKVKKSALKGKLDAVNLTTKYESITDIESLEKFLQIVSQ